MSVIPILPAAISIGEAKGSLIKHENVALSAQRNSAFPVSTRPGYGFSPVRIGVFLSQRPRFISFQIDKAGDTSIRRYEVTSPKPIRKGLVLLRGKELTWKLCAWLGSALRRVENAPKRES